MRVICLLPYWTSKGEFTEMVRGLLVVVSALGNSLGRSRRNTR